MQFEFGENFGGGQNRVGIFPDLARHFEQDAMNLGEFFIQQPHQFVVLLDGFERLDEDGLATGTGAVDDALHAAFLLDLHGDDETLAADGDEFVLHGAAFGEFPENSAERFLDQPLLFLDLAADAAQLGRSPVVERAVGQDLVAEGAQESGEVLDGGGKRGHCGPLETHGGRGLADDLAPLGGAVGDEDNVANLAGFQSRSGNPGFLDQLRDLGQAGELKASADAAELADFGGEPMLGFNPGAIEGGAEFRDAALAQRRRGVAEEQVAQALELQQAGAGVEDRIGDKRHAL